MGWLWWIGLAGACLPLVLDRLDILVRYEDWLARGQPAPPPWRTALLIGYQLGLVGALIGSALAHRFSHSPAGAERSLSPG